MFERVHDDFVRAFGYSSVVAYPGAFEHHALRSERRPASAYMSVEENAAWVALVRAHSHLP